MESSKYPLRSQDFSFATGETDLRDSRGSLIDTDGCIVLSVLSGCATATINSGRHPLRREDFILLFYDSSISIDKSSRTFRVKYLSIAYPLLEEVIYNPLSQNFWDVVYASPVLHPSPPPVRPVVRMVAADRMDFGHTGPDLQRRTDTEPHTQPYDRHRHGDPKRKHPEQERSLVDPDSPLLQTPLPTLPRDQGCGILCRQISDNDHLPEQTQPQTRALIPEAADRQPDRLRNQKLPHQHGHAGQGHRRTAAF